MKASRDVDSLQRTLGVVSGEAPGPLLLAVGGIHGNEPAGVAAAQRVLAALEERRHVLRGRFVALAGNLGALRVGRRFVERDLNRIWSDEDFERQDSGDLSEARAEAREQAELLSAIGEHLQESWEQVILLDLHSTSAAGSPFTIMADTLQNRTIACALPMPVILGLEERVEGTLLAHFAETGHVALCIEGGQNDAPATIVHHEAALWLGLEAGGLLRPEDVPEREAHAGRLRAAAHGLPRVVEMRHRHPIQPGERFEMRPGFANFQRVRSGDLLAHDGPLGRNPVHAPASGLLLMPRYQGQGDDGFFLGRRVSRGWLVLSALLRRARLDRVIPWLPGLRRDPSQPRCVRADPQVARWLLVEILHLFGYRRAASEAGAIVFVRRPDRF